METSKEYYQQGSHLHLKKQDAVCVYLRFLLRKKATLKHQITNNTQKIATNKGKENTRDSDSATENSILSKATFPAASNAKIVKLCAPTVKLLNVVFPSNVTFAKPSRL